MKDELGSTWDADMNSYVTFHEEKWQFLKEFPYTTISRKKKHLGSVYMHSMLHPFPDYWNC